MSHHTHDERVRLKAYEIWLNEGKPEGRDAYHWAMAREAVGYEDAARSLLRPDPENDDAVPPVSRVEPAKRRKAG